MAVKIEKICLLLIIIMIISLIFGCNNSKDQINTDNISHNFVSDFPINMPINDDVEKIEVYHFHGASQCFSCMTIKEFAEKTVNTNYPDLLESERMEFRSINIELPENSEVTTKYGAKGSSLWIGTYINGEFHKEQDTNVWYKVRDEEDFLNYLKRLLDKRLSGDLS